VSLAFTASIASAQAPETPVQTAQAGQAAAQPVQAGEAAQPAKPAGRGLINLDDIVERMSQSERAVLVRLRTYQPLVEVYVQNVASDDARGWVPTDDNYFLGQFHLDDTPTLRPVGKKEPRGGVLHGMGSNTLNLKDAFAAMVAPDWRMLDKKRYEFKYVRREFLGETRCFVFDVKPLKTEKEGFVGRIWVEDRDYNLVRFNGINRGTD